VTYDLLGQLVSVGEAVGTALAQTTTLAYDAAGNRTSGGTTTSSIAATNSPLTPSGRHRDAFCHGSSRLF
jgi:YD repeat-containing protein